MASARRWSLAGVLLVVYAVAVVSVIGILGLVVDRAAYRALHEEVEEGMVQQALALAAVADLDDPQGFVDSVGSSVDSRVTLIAADGDVIGDSLADADTMENHAGRPEVEAAWRGEVGLDTRTSETTGGQQLYVAIPAPNGAVLRLSLSDETVRDRLSDFRVTLLWLVGAAVLVGVLVVGLVARLLARPLSRLAESATAVAHGGSGLSVPRSSVAELDDLGKTVGEMADELGARLDRIEGERGTLEVILESLPQGTLLVGSDGSILYANKTFGEMLGRPPDRLDRLTPFRLQELVRQAKKDGEAVDTELEHGRPPRILRVLVTTLADERALVVIDDVTARRRVDQVRRDFVTNASHELKTPVASILASAETLQIALDKAPDRVPQFAGQIEQAAKNLAGIISDLLDLSRVEVGSGDHETVSLVPVVVAEVERSQPLADERGVTLRTELIPAVVWGSAPDLGLAVRNLVDNAIRYTDSGGDVTIRVETAGDQAQVTVIDTGAGIPSRDLDRVFERFYRVDEARSRATGGTGLGLSIVRHVAESHGGKVAVESKLGSGSTFRLSLPLAIDQGTSGDA